MISALFITILPTLLLFILLPKIGLHVKSLYLRIALSWFGGIYLFSMGVFLIAHLFPLITDSALLYATITGLILVTLTLLFYSQDVSRTLNFFTDATRMKESIRPIDTIFIIFCFLFAVLFFTPHVQIEKDVIYSSPIYWDFHWHAAIIQNFVFGNNFPPQEEALAGAPLTYHFFGDFVIAMYESVGFSIAQALNFVSVLVFFALLMTIVGFAQELFHRKQIGYIAVVLTMTSSSWRFVTDFKNMQGLSIFQMVGSILTNAANPFQFSFLPDRNPSTYAGTMFNLFYYLEERHMMFGFIYLLLALVLLTKRKTFSSKLLFACGLLFGAFFFWHIYICFMILFACVLLLFFDNERKKTLLILLGFFLSFGPQYSFVKQTLANSSWFYQHTTSYPRFNPTFAATGVHNNVELMIQLIVAYFVFAYGLKLIFFIIGFCIIWKQNKTLAKVLATILLPTFLMINTLEISPQGMGDNHKLLVPMNIVVNLVSAVSVFYIFFKKKTLMNLSFGCLCLFLLTISGIIELMPFFNSKPTDIYATYGKNSLTQTIRQKSSPQSIFIGKHQKEIQLAGRKLYVGPNAGPTDTFNTKIRSAIVKSIYNAPTFTEVCQRTKNTRITYVEFEATQAPAFNPTTTKFFTGTDDHGKRAIFININESCNHL